MISAIRSSLSGTMFKWASFWKVTGSTASAVPSQLLPTHSTERVAAAAHAGDAAASAATASASRSATRGMRAILDRLGGWPRRSDRGEQRGDRGPLAGGGPDRREDAAAES